MAHDDENGSAVGGAKHRNRDGIAGPLTRMTHDQAQLGAGRRNQAYR